MRALRQASSKGLTMACPWPARGLPACRGRSRIRKVALGALGFGRPLPPFVGSVARRSGRAQNDRPTAPDIARNTDITTTSNVALLDVLLRTSAADPAKHARSSLAGRRCLTLAGSPIVPDNIQRAKGNKP